MKKIALFIFCLSFITSCDTDNHIQLIDIDNISISKMEREEVFVINELFKPSDLYVVNDYIIFNCTDAGSSFLFYLYDKTNGEFKGKFTSFGRANNEAYWLNTNYIYDKDDTIFVNTNDFKESVYKVDDLGLTLIDNSKVITDEVFLTYLKIGDDKFLGKSDAVSTEYVLVDNSKAKRSYTNVGEYPNYDNSQLENDQKRMCYSNRIATISNSTYAFYNRIPLARKYNDRMELVKEIQIGAIPTFNIKDVRTMRAFALTKTDNDKIYTLFSNNKKLEIIVFDSDLQPITRYEISDKIRGFDVNDDYLYLYESSDSKDKIIKYRLTDLSN